MLRDVVVVGASLAGLRAAETLRTDGFDGRLAIVGAEAHLPYDRPPLSKKVLAGEWEPDRIHLRKPDEYDDLGFDLHLGVKAVGLDTAARRRAPERRVGAGLRRAGHRHGCGTPPAAGAARAARHLRAADARRLPRAAPRPGGGAAPCGGGRRRLHRRRGGGHGQESRAGGVAGRGAPRPPGPGPRARPWEPRSPSCTGPAASTCASASVSRPWRAASGSSGSG